MGVRGFGKCLYCRMETCRRNERPAQKTRGVPLPPVTEGYTGGHLGWAGELPGRWRCQQEVWGQWEVQADVCTAGVAECMAPTPSVSLLPSLSPNN